MANALYAKGKEKILSADIDFVSDTIKVALIKNDYAQNLATDEFYTSISASVLNTPQTLSSKSVTAGVFDAGDATFTAATSPLLAYIDVITGFPLATNGGDITIQWDNGAYKIFSL